VGIGTNDKLARADLGVFHQDLVTDALKGFAPDAFKAGGEIQILLEDFGALGSGRRHKMVGCRENLFRMSQWFAEFGKGFNEQGTCGVMKEKMIVGNEEMIILLAQKMARQNFVNQGLRHFLPQQAVV
jgi:hypothetical protein